MLDLSAKLSHLPVALGRAPWPGHEKLAIPWPTTGHTSASMRTLEVGKDQVRTGAPPGT